MTSPKAESPEIVYGVKAIAKIINEPNERRAFYLLERNYIPGSWKAGRTWALTVPAFRRAIGLDAQRDQASAKPAGEAKD